MKKVRVIARATAKPGKEEELRELLRGMLAPTHAEEGCELYELYESQEAGKFYFYELWTSRQALDAHTATPHFIHLKRVVGDLVSGPLEVDLLQAVS